MIVYGQNHFKIKSFTQQELRIPKENGIENIDIQVRQRYAHLFWIPFFPIGKLYGFKRQGDSNLYELPLGIKQVIQTKHSHEIKTPWYSYSLIIIALVAGLWYFVGEEMSSINRQNRTYLNKAKQEMMVKYPTTGDYYAFDAYIDDTGYKNTPIVLKVNSYDDETIEFTSGYENLYEKGISGYSISREFDKEGQYFHQPTRIDKELILQMIAENHSSGNARFLMEDYDYRYFKFEKIKRKKLKEE